MPALRLVDVTIGYPGIPRGGYGQDYYTLQSIFGHAVPPPLVHMHLRSFARYETPIGMQSLASSALQSPDSTEAEKKVFDEWLLNRWRMKDDQLENFVTSGKLSDGPYVDIPVRLRSPLEVMSLLISLTFGLWLSKLVLSLLWRILVRR